MSRVELLALSLFALVTMGRSCPAPEIVYLPGPCEPGVQLEIGWGLQWNRVTQFRKAWPGECLQLYRPVADELWIRCEGQPVWIGPSDQGNGAGYAFGDCENIHR